MNQGLPLAALALASVFAQPVAAQCPADDSFEDNDDCTTPASITTGVHGNLVMTVVDWDYYTIDVPHGFDLVVDQLDSGFGRGLQLQVGPLCPAGANETTQVANNGPAGARSITHRNESGATQSVHFSSMVWTGQCESYDLSIALVPSPCGAAIDDNFEPNDDCSNAAALPSGLHAGLLTDKLRPDHFAIQVPAGEVLNVDQTSSEGAAHALELFADATCTQAIGAVLPTENANRASWTNHSGSTATVYARCSIRTNYVPGCARYDLNVVTTADPCASPGSDDFAEDNESCATASPLHTGLDLDLFVSKQDVDYYEFTVQPGEYLAGMLEIRNPTTDLEVYIFDDPAECTNLANGWVRFYDCPALPLPHGFGWVNQGSVTSTLYMLVRVADSSEGDCTSYDLNTRREAGPIENTFCFGDGTAGPRGAHDVACPCNNASAIGSRSGCLNSQGHGAMLRTQFDSLVPQRLVVSQARPNMPAMLLQGASLIGLPFEDGILCMGNPTERLEVLFLDGQGHARTTVDLFEQSGALPGDRLYYQVWYRDPVLSPCGNGSNLTNGVTVRW